MALQDGEPVCLASEPFYASWVEAHGLDPNTARDDDEPEILSTYFEEENADGDKVLIHELRDATGSDVRDVCLAVLEERR